MAEQVKALYGFSPDLAPFVGKTVAERVVLLQSWGTTAVFGGYEDAGFVEAVHAAGMKVYAEFGCFVGENWWERVPASRPVTAKGRLLEKEEQYCGVNPSTPQVRQEQLKALEKLLANCDIDGVWLDFIRWPCHWEVPIPYLPRTSFDPDTLARFSRDAGVELLSGDVPGVAQALLAQHEAEWAAWRVQQVTSWVADAKNVLRRVRPGALLGLFGVPWRSVDHDGAILTIIGQDYRALARYVDVFSPMVYHLMCGHPPNWIGEVVEDVHALSGKPVWPIVQSIDHPAPLPAEEYAQTLEVALGTNSSAGVIVFTLAGVLTDGAKLTVTKARFGA